MVPKTKPLLQNSLTLSADTDSSKLASGSHDRALTLFLQAHTGNIQLKTFGIFWNFGTHDTYNNRDDQNVSHPLSSFVESWEMANMPVAGKRKERAWKIF